jgi:hypothetical protein
MGQYADGFSNLGGGCLVRLLVLAGVVGGLLFLLSKC